MSSKKAMVSRIKDGHCMIVTDDGQFKRIPLPRKPVQVGEIIEYKEAPSLKWFKPILMVASFFVVFMGFYVYQQSLPPGPLTYITLDINPSIQLGLNKNDTVVEAVPLNDDGKKLLTKLDYKGRNYDLVVKDLVTEAADQGYLTSNQENVIVASLYNQTPTPEQKAQEQKVRRSIGQSLSKKKLKAKVMIYKVDQKVWQEAKKSRLSAGKVAFLKEMKAQGIDIPKAELSKKSIKKILKSLPNTTTMVYRPAKNPQVDQDVFTNKLVIKKSLKAQDRAREAKMVREDKGSRDTKKVREQKRVQEIKEALQDKKTQGEPKTLKPLRPIEQRKSKPAEAPNPARPNPEVTQTTYDEPTIPQEYKKPPRISPERPVKKIIEKKIEKEKTKR